jgi:RecJ-like exonuclease
MPPPSSNPCPRCDGRGVCAVDLRRFGLGSGFYAFMTAGTKPTYHDDGSATHDIVCPRCDGKGELPCPTPAATPTPPP